MADFMNASKSNRAINVQFKIHIIEKVAEKQLVIDKPQKLDYP